MRVNGSLLDLLLEVQILDRVPRIGYPMRGVADGESVTEHSWHVVFLVWAIGPRIAGLDVARAMEIALVHDLAELRIGDLPQVASRYFPPGAKQAAESAALEEILAPLPAASRALFAEYLAGQSQEARLVKACDKLQLMLKVATYERGGAGGLKEFWGNPANFTDGGFAEVRELFEELRRRHESGSGGGFPG
ncbi:MAG TPA: HD domain-containing protein [Thermoanaerobaculia bacterium]|nr:HD domain-containing protein [Thermoanaerobaculia bacterium]